MKNAGYTIVKVEVTEIEGNISYGVALAENEKTHQWCTWQFNCENKTIHTEEKWSFYWGHYFDYRREAMADYHRRLLKQYEF